jgi:hypothetical protein
MVGQVVRRPALAGGQPIHHRPRSQAAPHWAMTTTVELKDTYLISDFVGAEEDGFFVGWHRRRQGSHEEADRSC